MKRLMMGLSVLALALFFNSTSASAHPQPEPNVIMVCNVNGLFYNIDQYYGIYAPNGAYMGQLVAAATPSGWIAVRGDGVQFPVYGCR